MNDAAKGLSPTIFSNPCILNDETKNTGARAAGEINEESKQERVQQVNEKRKAKTCSASRKVAQERTLVLVVSYSKSSAGLRVKSHA